MITNLTFFETEEDLEHLTGLTQEQLWDSGFNLDDMDWGFCTDINCVETHTEEWPPGYVSAETKYKRKDGAPYYLTQLTDWMDGYCVGYNAVYYNGKSYFTLHHA